MTIEQRFDSDAGWRRAAFLNPPRFTNTGEGCMACGQAATHARCPAIDPEPDCEPDWDLNYKAMREEEL